VQRGARTRERAWWDLSADLRIGNTDADIVYGLTEARPRRSARRRARGGIPRVLLSVRAEHLMGLLPLLEEDAWRAAPRSA